MISVHISVYFYFWQILLETFKIISSSVKPTLGYYYYYYIIIIIIIVVVSTFHGWGPLIICIHFLPKLDKLTLDCQELRHIYYVVGIVFLSSDWT